MDISMGNSISPSPSPPPSPPPSRLIPAHLCQRVLVELSLSYYSSSSPGDQSTPDGIIDIICEYSSHFQRSQTDSGCESDHFHVGHHHRDTIQFDEFNFNLAMQIGLSKNWNIIGAVGMGSQYANGIALVYQIPSTTISDPPTKVEKETNSTRNDTSADSQSVSNIPSSRGRTLSLTRRHFLPRLGNPFTSIVNTPICDTLSKHYILHFGDHHHPTLNEFQLDLSPPDEFINGVSVEYGAWYDRVILHTSKGREWQLGLASRGTLIPVLPNESHLCLPSFPQASLLPPLDIRIVALSTGVGGHIHNLGYWYESMHSASHLLEILLKVLKEQKQLDRACVALACISLIRKVGQYSLTRKIGGELVEALIHFIEDKNEREELKREAVFSLLNIAYEHLPADRAAVLMKEIVKSRAILSPSKEEKKREEKKIRRNSAEQPGVIQMLEESIALYPLSAHSPAALSKLNQFIITSLKAISTRHLPFD